MSSIKSRFLKRLVIFHHLFSCRKMSSSGVEAKVRSLSDFGYKFNTEGGF